MGIDHKRLAFRDHMKPCHHPLRPRVGAERPFQRPSQSTTTTISSRTPGTCRPSSSRCWRWERTTRITTPPTAA
eukprot:2711153-Pyramimonas_sp.AAC.1